MTPRSCDHAAIIADWFKPLSRAQIAARHGCSERQITRVWQRAQEKGRLPHRRRDANDERNARFERIVADWFEPLSLVEVAAKNGCSWRTVARLWTEAR